MVQVGSVQSLTVLRQEPGGWILEGEAVLPSGEAPGGMAIGSSVPVMVFHGVDGRLTATLRPPRAQVGEVAFLKVVAVKDAGAFLDWGLPRDLLLPWREVRFEQKAGIQPGKRVLVAVFEDEQGRVAASARVADFLSDRAEGYVPGQKVQVLAVEPTDLGMRVVVDHRHWGLVHQSDIFGSFSRGEVREAYVKTLRADQRLDITLAAPGYAKVDPLAQRILDLMARRGGFLALTDRSAPEAIHEALGASKKAFKQAVGALYKAQRITLEPEGIRLREG